MTPLAGVAPLDQPELASQREREPPRAHPAGYGFALHAVLHRDPLRPALRPDQAVDEVQRRGVAQPAIPRVVEDDEVPVMILVSVILLALVVRPVHVAVFGGAAGRIELGDRAQVLDAHVLDAARIAVLD